MKLLYFNDYRLGVLKGDASSTYRRWSRRPAHRPRRPDQRRDRALARPARTDRERRGAAGSGVPVAAVKIRSPLPKPVNIDCMAVNYMEDGTRKEPAPINAFLKSPGCDRRPRRHVVLPDIPVADLRGRGRARAW